MAFFDYDLQNTLQQLGIAEYNRRSSTDKEDKQMRSIEGQHEDIETDIVKKFNLKNIILLQESQSAFKVGRPKFQELLTLIENGTVQAVLVWHPNRIARNYSDGGTFVQLMADGKLKYVVTPHGIFENTPRDQEYLMTEFTRATRDSGDKSDAVKRGNRIKLKLGHIPSGRLSEGFIHKKNERDEMVNTGDPDRFPLIEKAFKLVYEQTHTPMEALAVLNNEWGYTTRKTKRMGGKPMAKSTWYKLLSDPKYYGEIQRSEGSFKADFPKALNKDQFEKIQIILGNKASRRKTKKEWPYTGEMLCGECRGFITQDEKWQIICSVCKTKFHKAKDRDNCPECHTLIENMKQPKILHFSWVLCSKKKKLQNGQKCSQKSLPVKDFEKQVDDLLKGIEIPKEFTDWALSWLQKQNNVEIEERSTIQKNLQNLYNDIQKQIDTLLDFLVKGFIEQNEYQRKKDLLLLERQEISKKLKTTEKRADDWLELTEKTFLFATYARVWFAEGTIEQKRTILRTLGTNLILKDKILSLDQHKPFVIMKQMKEKIEDLDYKSEPTDFVDKSTQNASFGQANPSLLYLTV